jgi:hypothetical protein
MERQTGIKPATSSGQTDDAFRNSARNYQDRSLARIPNISTKMVVLNGTYGQMDFYHPGCHLTAALEIRTGQNWSGRRGSNPQPTAWEAATLPLSYSRYRDHYIYAQCWHDGCNQGMVSLAFGGLASGFKEVEETW